MKDLVNSGVNIVAFEKNGHKYGMTCAWMMQVDEDQLLMLLGSQSETANRIEEDDIIGISSLALGQEEIAELFGTKHSRKINKFSKILYEEEDGALIGTGVSASHGMERTHIQGIEATLKLIFSYLC